jgi:hypothetical protein
MKNKVISVLSLVVGLLLAATPLVAHHGVGLFEQDRSISIKGTITQFDFVNPHVEIYFEAKDDKGNVVKWMVESGSPNLMRRSGWNKNTLKPGEEVTFVGRPGRNGAKAMRLLKVVRSNGEEILPEKTMD